MGLARRVVRVRRGLKPSSESAGSSSYSAGHARPHQARGRTGTGARRTRRTLPTRELVSGHSANGSDGMRTVHLAKASEELGAIDGDRGHPGRVDVDRGKRCCGTLTLTKDDLKASAQADTMILTLRDKTQLDSLRDTLAAHGRTWNGEWSPVLMRFAEPSLPVLRDKVLPSSLVRLIKELAFDAEEVYDSAIRMLSPFIEALDVSARCDDASLAAQLTREERSGRLGLRSST